MLLAFAGDAVIVLRGEELQQPLLGHLIGMLVVSLNKSYEPIMKSLVMVFPPIKQDAVLPGGILLNTNFLRICSFLLCKHPYKFYLKIVSKKLLRDDL